MTRLSRTQAVQTRWKQLGKGRITKVTLSLIVETLETEIAFALNFYFLLKIKSMKLVVKDVRVMFIPTKYYFFALFKDIWNNKAGQTIFCCTI